MTASALNSCSFAPAKQAVFSTAVLRTRPLVKFFVTDLDGTLLPPSLQISERSFSAFNQLKHLGVQCAIATGRSLPGTISCLGEAALQQMNMPYGRPGVYMNGCLVIGKSGKILHLEYLSQQQTQHIVALAEQYGWLPRLSGYAENNIFSLEEDEFTTALHEKYGEPAPQVVTREVFSNTKFCKIAVNGTPEDVCKFRRILGEILGGTDLRPVAPIPCSVEILPAQASKAAGLRVLLQHLQLQQEEMLAMGDSENDVEMLKFAGVSICVENASAVAKAAATYVTCRCDDDAVAKAAEAVAEVYQERKS